MLACVENHLAGEGRGRSFGSCVLAVPTCVRKSLLGAVRAVRACEVRGALPRENGVCWCCCAALRARWEKATRETWGGVVLCVGRGVGELHTRCRERARGHVWCGEGSESEHRAPLSLHSHRPARGLQDGTRCL